MNAPKKVSLSEWIAELRSGRVAQCRAALVSHGPNGWAYCCLGVYEKMCGVQAAGMQYWPIGLLMNKVPELPDNAYQETSYMSDGDDRGGTYYNIVFPLHHNGLEERTVLLNEVPPKEEREKLDYIGWITASGMNDDGFTFDQIADMLEHFYGSAS